MDYALAIECGCGVRHRVTLPAYQAGVPAGAVEGLPGHGAYPVNRAGAAAIIARGYWACPDGGQRPRP